MVPGGRAASIAATLGLHLVVLIALLQLDAVRKPLLEAVPLMVNLIPPPQPEPPPEAIPPKPKPIARSPLPQRPVARPPLLAVESSAPVTAAVAPQPQPEPVVPLPAPAPPRVVPPSFDAAYLQNPPPAYPLMSRRRGEQGKVVLRVHVTADGAADQVQVRISSGHERLDQAATEAVRQWRFVPARQGDQPFAAWVLVPIVFALER
jgi:protein TonB